MVFIVRQRYVCKREQAVEARGLAAFSLKRKTSLSGGDFRCAKVESWGL